MGASHPTKVPLLRILNPRADFLGPEIVYLAVGFCVEEAILVVTEPVAEAAVLPGLFEEGFALLRRVFERVKFRKGIKEPIEALLAELEGFRVAVF